LSCDTCQLVVGLAGDIASNQTSLNDLLKVADAGCDVVFANNSLAKDGCELIASLVVDLMPKIQQGLQTLAWDPIAFCATFIPVCTMNCCPTDTDPEQVCASVSQSCCIG
jgi:hypothetical protein